MGFRCAAVIFVIGLIGIGTGLFLGFYMFPKFVKTSVDDSVKLINGSDAYKQWEKLPIPLKFKVYFFNVTNPEDVKQGKKAVLKEVGPYIYKQFRERQKIKNEGNGTLSYIEKQIYKFDTDDSKPNSENDEITIVNLPLMAIATGLGDESGLNFDRNKDLPALFGKNGDIFMKTTPRDFLFDGIPLSCEKISPLICDLILLSKPKQLEQITKPGQNWTELKFSLLSSKNKSIETVFKIHDGTTDLDKLGTILSRNNLEKLDVWKSRSPRSKCVKSAAGKCVQSKRIFTCNDIQGTDGTIFPPHRTSSTPLLSFDTDICRTVELNYEKKVTLGKNNDISAHRYKVNEHFLKSYKSFKENECFCVNETLGLDGKKGCLLDGALELMTCQEVPLVFTFPHFYRADAKYQKGVEGLKPNEDLHSIFIDVEPETGVILRGSKRGQLNIFFRKFKYITLTENLTSALMPVLWIDEGVDQPKVVLDQLETKFFKPVRLLNYAFYGIVGAGGFLVLLSVILCFCVRSGNSEKYNITK